MLQSTGSKECPTWEGRISWGRGNRGDLLADLGAGEHRNLRDQVEGWAEGENTERDDWKRGFDGLGRSPRHRKLTQVYKDSPS